MAREIPTFHDAILGLTRFARVRGLGSGIGDMRSAIIDAYQELSESFAWSHARKRYRVNLVAPQTTGTVAYTASTRTLTLTGATWPTDAIDWTVVVNNVTYDVESYTDTTNIVLDTVQAPTSDIAAGTSFSIYRRYYLLPDDFISADDPMPEQSKSIAGDYIPLDDLHARMRADPSSGSASAWSIGPVQDVYGRSALYLWQPDSTAQTLDIWYRAMPRPLRYGGVEAKCSAGTIAVTANSAAVTGSSTTFESGMAGSIFRIGDNATYQPMGLRDERPWVEQRSILTFSSTTSITLDNVVATTRASTKYTVTDPLDLDPVAITPLFRIAERNLSQALGGKGVRQDIDRAYSAILTARGASNQASNRVRVAGQQASYAQRPADGTFSFDDGGEV